MDAFEFAVLPDDVKFIGSWVEQGVFYTWRFYADRTGLKEKPFDKESMVYAVNGNGKMVLTVKVTSTTWNSYSYEYYFIDAGNMLLLYNPGGNTGHILRRMG
jgi:hypothetical protein